VDTGCELIQEALVELNGDSTRLCEAHRRHLDSCASCRQLAEQERSLGQLLATAVPPADPTVEEWVMRSIRQTRARDRWAAVLPVAASLLLTMAGVVGVGGVPGSGLVTRLPAVFSQGWNGLVGVFGDWMVALGAAASAAQLALPTPVQAVSLAIAVIGSVSVFVAGRRWRRLSPWRIHA
jgi:hypothetical protein